MYQRANQTHLARGIRIRRSHGITTDVLASQNQLINETGTEHKSQLPLQAELTNQQPIQPALPDNHHPGKYLFNHDRHHPLPPSPLNPWQSVQFPEIPPRYMGPGGAPSARAVAWRWRRGSALKPEERYGEYNNLKTETSYYRWLMRYAGTLTYDCGRWEVGAGGLLVPDGSSRRWTRRSY